MSTVRQLYQLHEFDLEIDSNEQALTQKTSQMGESQAVISTQAELDSEQQRLDDLKHQQHSAEWEIDDLTSKIKTTEGQLYSGKITNPKELTGLQHEVETLKTRRDQVENDALGTMDRVEQAEAGIAALKGELEKLKGEWQSQQQQLSVEIDQLKSVLTDLQQKRQRLADEIDPQAIELYQRLRNQKRQAVSRVEQGICLGCRISLSSSELQQARGGNLVQCSSCGRILFSP